MVLQEASPAYQMLKRQNLLTSKYRIRDAECKAAAAAAAEAAQLFSRATEAARRAQSWDNMWNGWAEGLSVR